jgi:hypothetical protein
VDDAAVTALGKLWSERCPLADPASRATVLDVGWRRWRSFEAFPDVAQSTCVALADMLLLLEMQR